MRTESFRSRFTGIWRVAFAVLILVVVVIGYIIYESTLVAWWVPVAVAAVIAVATLPLFHGRWCWLVGNDMVMELFCHLYVMGGVGYGLPLAANSLLADVLSAREETVTVVDKEHVTRRTGYRSGRHYRTTSRVTEYHYVTVAFADGTVKELPVTRAEYHRAHGDRPWKVSTRRGLLGFRVVETGTFAPYKW